MNKQKLIFKIESIQQDEISLFDVLELFTTEKDIAYAKKVIQKVQQEFELKDVFKRSQKQKYVCARAVVYRILNLRGLEAKRISELIQHYDRTTILHALIKFDTYFMYYNEYSKPINRCLDWSLNNN
jgi:hypothetical protein